MSTSTARVILGTRTIDFPGTAEERAANRLTHQFWWGDPDDDCRCTECDCRPFSLTASWPCGAEVPREAFYRQEAA